MVDRHYCYGKDDFGGRYDALYEADSEGDWVYFEDYDALAALLMSTYACCCRECADKIRGALPDLCAKHDSGAYRTPGT